MSPIQRTNHSFSLAFCWQDIGLMAIILVSLNIIDVFSTMYAITVLGFMEFNEEPEWISKVYLPKIAELGQQILEENKIIEETTKKNSKIKPRTS